MERAAGRRGISVAQLGAAKGFSLDYLTSLGLVDLDEGGVGIPYYDASGDEITVRRRTAIVARNGSYWTTGQSAVAYGQWRQHEAAHAGHLWLVEGESDCWALWLHNQPALGIPGSGCAKVIEREHLVGVTRVYIWREPDQGGAAFVPAVAARLAVLGWQGELYEAQIEGVKDPADLHLKDAEHFAARLGACRQIARQLTDGASAPPHSNGTASGTMPHGKGGSGESAGQTADDYELPIPPPEPWPAGLCPDAYQGLAGEIVSLIAPQTEADPVAVLVQILTLFGNAIGRGAYWQVEEDKHAANLYACLVGETARGRKGTSKGRALAAFGALGDDWAQKRIVSGLSSGEGLIWAVRDERHEKQPVKQKGRVVDHQTVLVDEGVADKRLMVIESEFVLPLRSMAREGNTLSARLREGWDSGNLAALTKHSAARATGAHISILGHITCAELRQALRDVEAANGFANRFLWVAVRRSKLLPLGGEPVDLGHLAHKIALAVERARSTSRVGLDSSAKLYWCREVYPRLAAGHPGLLGAVLNRAEAQVRRLAMVYALLDFAENVTPEHLLAALSLWDYCAASARWIFGDSTGDRLADDIRIALLTAGADGLTQNDLVNLFNRHESASKIGRAMAVLLQTELVYSEKIPSGPAGGRPATRWYAELRDKRENPPGGL